MTRKVRFDLSPAVVPENIRDAIGQFLLDGRTGNVQLNVRDGEILGIRIEELISAKTADRTRPAV